MKFNMDQPLLPYPQVIFAVKSFIYHIEKSSYGINKLMAIFNFIMIFLSILPVGATRPSDDNPNPCPNNTQTDARGFYLFPANKYSSMFNQSFDKPFYCCRCPFGSFLDGLCQKGNFTSTVCRKWRKCPPGVKVLKKGTFESDTICEDRVAETFPSTIAVPHQPTSPLPVATQPSGHGLTGGAVAGIFIGVFLVLVLVAFIMYRVRKKNGGRNNSENEDQGRNGNSREFAQELRPMMSHENEQDPGTGATSFSAGRDPGPTPASSPGYNGGPSPSSDSNRVIRSSTSTTNSDKSRGDMSTPPSRSNPVSSSPGNNGGGTSQTTPPSGDSNSTNDGESAGESDRFLPLENEQAPDSPTPSPSGGRNSVNLVVDNSTNEESTSLTGSIASSSPSNSGDVPTQTRSASVHSDRTTNEESAVASGSIPSSSSDGNGGHTPQPSSSFANYDQARQENNEANALGLGQPESKKKSSPPLGSPEPQPQECLDGEVFQDGGDLKTTDLNTEKMKSPHSDGSDEACVAQQSSEEEPPEKVSIPFIVDKIKKRLLYGRGKKDDPTMKISEMFELLRLFKLYGVADEYTHYQRSRQYVFHDGFQQLIELGPQTFNLENLIKMLTLMGKILFVNIVKEVCEEYHYELNETQDVDSSLS